MMPVSKILNRGEHFSVLESIFMTYKSTSAGTEPTKESLILLIRKEHIQEMTGKTNIPYAQPLLYSVVPCRLFVL